MTGPASVWVAPDGRRLTVEEDSPGYVHVTTEALGHLFAAAGWTQLAGPEEDIVEPAVTDVVRDGRGRCMDCGASPQEVHRADCAHAGEGIFGAGYERRPRPTTGEERR